MKVDQSGNRGSVQVAALAEIFGGVKAEKVQKSVKGELPGTIKFIFYPD